MLVHSRGMTLKVVSNGQHLKYLRPFDLHFVKIKSLKILSFHTNETFILNIIVPNLNLFNCKIVHIIHGYFQYSAG